MVIAAASLGNANCVRAREGAPIVNVLEEAPAGLEDEIKSLGDKGAQFQFNYWGEAFANLSGGVERGGDYDGLAKLSLGLDLQKLIGWNGGSFYVSVLYPHGNGITDRYVHDYNVLSNIDAYDSFRVFECWLEQAFFDGKFSIRAGQLTTDNDFFVSNNGALYINSAFGTLGTALHNIVSPIYPVGADGIRLEADFTPSFYVKSMFVDDNPGLQNYNDKHGLRLGPNRGDGLLGYCEAGYTPHPSNSGSGLIASYKLGGFFDTQFHPDISNASASHGDCALYVSVDQPLYFAPGSTDSAPRGLSTFGQFSYAPDQRNAVVYYFDTGLDYTGLLPSRPQDIAGIAFSFERLGVGVTQASGLPVLSHHEHVIELTYLANLSDRFSLQPDFQYIINPGAVGRIPNAFVAGLRFNVNF